MKANTFKKEPHLKLIKNTKKKKTANARVNRIYINTLIPGFSYLNKAKKTIIPENCALL
ncbi:MAG: hypothetical protein HKP59_05235 [Lutibacter sp.]|uniref:hypothetical protein n=1 Tax=Lutibacter sp. TaxID=1925666 RepID=UPI0017ECAAB2|nr:hypothetical protein [Lutibacter sp.]MBT8317007.1 hypothetical protein [Lutibacter sp.]NNJ57867.1 hypothetical protein [Lutibacter sp.]